MMEIKQWREKRKGETIVMEDDDCITQLFEYSQKL